MSKSELSAAEHGERSASIERSLLGLLAERPMHGYELHRELGRKSGLGLVWTVRQAQLYGILARLEAARLVASELVASGRGPARKVFHATAEGKAAFDEWAREPASRKDFRLDFLAKLIFAGKTGGRAAAALVASQRRSCDAWLQDMRAREAACEAGGLDTLVYRYRVGQLEATAAWLEECAAYVAAAKGAGATKKKPSKALARASANRRES
jgi:DNA-binding PadR family transcriptional regulator